MTLLLSLLLSLLSLLLLLLSLLFSGVVEFPNEPFTSIGSASWTKQDLKSLLDFS